MDNESKLYGALAYVLGFITGIVMLLIKPEDKFVKFHALQSILFSIAAFVISFAVSIVMSIFTAMFYINVALGLMMAGIFGLISLAVSGVLFVVWALLIWKAYNGETWKLPIIGAMAEKMVDTVNLAGTTTVKKETKTSKKK
ncbi:MAG: DUF4870 domain-containing protein [Candidatus Diapherotrites archaeon]|nr:DUF4870 domain-containing protein [Candidatus Diapherotrites archaeon]